MPAEHSFGTTERDIRSVQIYRAGIALSALAFLIVNTLLLVTQGWKNPSSTPWIRGHSLLLSLAVWMLITGVGISVLSIHLYIHRFHTLLKILYGIGIVSVVLLLGAGVSREIGFLSLLYETPAGTVGFGFILATLCGIAVKEAFCFGQIEAVLFAVVTPILVLGHLFQILNPVSAFLFLCADTLFLVFFAVRKIMMPIHLDIGDKTLYT